MAGPGKPVSGGRPEPSGRPVTKFPLPDGSRSVQSPWIWRGFLFLALIAFGLCLMLAQLGYLWFAAAWAFITLGWAGIGLWLWRRHVHDDDDAWRARLAKQAGRRPPR